MAKKQQRKEPDAEGAEELRGIAQALEATADEDLASLADLAFPLSTGNLREFPRPSPELRAAEEGLEYLRESVERAVAMLYALAAAREQGRELSPVLIAAVQPFIAALRPQK